MLKNVKVSKAHPIRQSAASSLMHMFIIHAISALVFDPFDYVTIGIVTWDANDHGELRHQEHLHRRRSERKLQRKIAPLAGFRSIPTIN